MFKDQLTTQQKKLVCTFEDGDPNENPWVKAKPEQVHIEVVAHDPDWFARFGVQKESIQKVLGDLALSIDHVGSTAVIGLAAKPIIDIDLIVENPENEASYVPTLESLGYELTIREPSWYQHRMLKLHDPMVNLHVFGKNCPEHHRHLLFKEWLQTHPDDLADYAAIKEIAKNDVNTMQAYNQKKQDVVRAIYQKIFATL
ncbi:GrpB family protein [Wohlfahrtiimonas populi]|uniref:GrpB family protein n=1 Tax=Wohlfahrtiimonas populi TaxID=1940240 RepID=UPI00098D5E1A|nr:GrpB family protein [Wohlfahrtiimonas populi]